jgi:hypothetical protein
MNNGFSIVMFLNIHFFQNTCFSIAMFNSLGFKPQAIDKYNIFKHSIGLKKSLILR